MREPSLELQRTPLDAALRREPSSVQRREFARLDGVLPHQSHREKARRQRQMMLGVIKGTVVSTDDARYTATEQLLEAVTEPEVPA